MEDPLASWKARVDLAPKEGTDGSLGEDEWAPWLEGRLNDASGRLSGPVVGLRGRLGLPCNGKRAPPFCDGRGALREKDGLSGSSLLGPTSIASAVIKLVLSLER